MSLLEARNLHKTFRLGRAQAVHALRGVNVTIEAGEMVAIVGSSGSGKSTLMHVLGLLHEPDRDSNPAPALSIAGVDVLRQSDRDRTRIRARELGFVFQSFNLGPTLTSAENVALAADYAGRGGKVGRVAALEALALVGLSDRAGHRPNQLSGGEQQRVAIARALACDPDIIFGDEPTGNLDTETAGAMFDLLCDLNQRGTTVVYVTHDPILAKRAARVVTIRDGLVVDETGGERHVA